MNLAGTGHAISPASQPVGNCHCRLVAIPAWPGFFQYVCQPGVCCMCSPSHSVCPAAMPWGAQASKRAVTASVRTVCAAYVCCAPNQPMFCAQPSPDAACHNNKASPMRLSRLHHPCITMCFPYPRSSASRAKTAKRHIFRKMAIIMQYGRQYKAPSSAKPITLLG